ncbi:MAG: SAM-dependent methyltransferase [Planctomycetota bacterium]|jgi:SAM-dependent methyltransferase
MNHVESSRTDWNATSDEYQARNEGQLDNKAMAWGVWGIPEEEVCALGPILGKRILELGCGAAQWSRFMAEAGAEPIGMDLSERQLHHARLKLRNAGVIVPLVHANAEQLPFANESFDLVFCDHGATTFSDPHRTIPDATRVLRRGGELVFNMASPMRDTCARHENGEPKAELERDYFSMHRIVDEDGGCYFNLPYGAWIRLFRRCGLELLDMIELQPPAGAKTTYGGYISEEWARRWPAEIIWRLRRRP